MACLANCALAQFVNDVNGLTTRQYLFDCCPSDLTVTNNYPLIAKFDEQFTGPPAGADSSNRHEFLFSSNGGTSPRTFNNDDSFDVSMDMVLEAGVNIPRKEAGFRANRSFQDGRFIVTTNEGALTTGEIVAFGGPFPFYSFDDNFGIRYTPGTSINLRMIYNEPGADPVEEPGTIEYLVNYDGNAYTSGPLEFTNTEGGIVNGNQVGVYMQATSPATNAQDDFGIATFTNFVFGIGETSLEGDHNKDGTVDAADYVAWRKDSLPETDYHKFVTHFGESAAGGGGSGSVPEPTTAVMAAMMLAGLLNAHRRP
jgi:hypothetical protein